MASVAAGLLAHAGLLVILQPDHLDQAQLLLQPVGVVFLGIRLLGDEDLTGDVIAVLLAQGDALGEVGAYAVLQVQVLAQHLLHGLAGLDRIRAHVRVALEEQDPAQDRVRVLRFLLHLVVDALVQLVQAQVLVAARVQEILVARGQLAAQEEVQVIGDFGISLHGGESLVRLDPDSMPPPPSRRRDGNDCPSHSRYRGPQPAIRPTTTALARSMKNPHTSGTITNARGAAPYWRVTAVMLAM